MPLSVSRPATTISEPLNNWLYIFTALSTASLMLVPESDGFVHQGEQLVGEEGGSGINESKALRLIDVRMKVTLLLAAMLTDTENVSIFLPETLR
ncbi:hypothetical protein EYF80_042954 [Liparis tanakae]|uniref:Uncharacterized protein n=1 Tax=Liparis tanakae TaxID=230148 RepID=A0A4Z2G167_9TELE|nr:hypothetical protein EYF80_042954 [Liparis tanakae]